MSNADMLHRALLEALAHRRRTRG